MARERLASLRTGDGRTGRDTGRGADRADADAPRTAMRGTGTADDERVRATAAGGRLVGLQLDPRTLRQPPDQLGAHIAAAANAALDDLRARAETADTEQPPDPAALAQTLRDVQEQGLRQLELISQSLSEATARIQGSRR
ncbi:hypothetical protein GCM10010411_58450 [Actinomadura fulvescens]|uniref:YbaB/EbfC DNA-binding family protein n=1 Tax=Actinomadura fulvescens TaxID=46160 RepID=A0ABN3Q4G6_9ACTN